MARVRDGKAMKKGAEKASRPPACGKKSCQIGFTLLLIRVPEVHLYRGSARKKGCCHVEIFEKPAVLPAFPVSWSGAVGSDLPDWLFSALWSRLPVCS